MNTRLLRCFIAVKLPIELRNEIEMYIKDLSGYTEKVRWVKIDSLHLTLKFLGEITTDKIEEIKSILEQSGDISSPFHLKVAGSGCFPGRKRPRVFWLGLESEAIPHLIKLYNWLENDLSRVGFEPEKRKFSPHLTIGRVKGDEDFSKLYSYLDSHPFRGQSFKVENISLIRSILKPAGAEYKDLSHYPLY